MNRITDGKISRCLPALLAGAIALVGGMSAAQAQTTLVSSTFNVDADGWVSAALNFPAAITTFNTPPAVLGTSTPNYLATGGNPGGFIQLPDPDGNVSYWQAPAKFLGNFSLAYGGTLEFDLSDDNTSTFDQEDVILIGGGNVLVFDTALNPGTTFTSYSILLTESAGWKLGSLTGAAPTPTEFQDALANITDIYIRGEFQNGADTASLDNVRLTSISVVPEPGSLVLLALGGVAGAAIRRRRVK